MNAIETLHVTTSFPKAPDDTAGPFIYRLVSSLHDTGMVECTVLTPGTTTKSAWPEGPFRVVRFPYGPTRLQTIAQQPGGIPQALRQSRLAWFMLPLLAMSMLYWVRRLAGDRHVIHAHWSAAGAVSSFALCGRPLIVTLHGSDVNRAKPGSILHLLLKRAVSKASVVAAVSEDMARRLKECFPSHSQKIRFVPNGVDEAFFRIDQEKRRDRKSTTFLFAGSLVRGKGVHDLIAALNEVREDERPRLLIAGDGRERQALEAQSAALGLGRQVRFLGRVSPDLMASLMEEADCLVLPSYSEGRPSVVLEAMASALPVVATDIPGNRELVNHGLTGLLFPPGDVEALARAMERISERRDERYRMGAEGRRWMRRKELTWQATARRYVEIYREIGLPART